jgi:hypothetical protein
MILLTFLVFTASLFILFKTFKHMANIGNNWVLVQSEDRIKPAAKNEYTSMSVKYSQFYVIVILGIMAINAAFIYAVFNPQILN